MRPPSSIIQFTSLSLNLGCLETLLLLGLGQPPTGKVGGYGSDYPWHCNTKTVLIPIISPFTPKQLRANDAINLADEILQAPSKGCPRRTCHRSGAPRNEGNLVDINKEGAEHAGNVQSSGG
jgi:hypothetical protein